MPNTEAAVAKIERALKDLQTAWNTAEGRRGRLAEIRQRLAAQQSQLDAEREALRQEQWKLKKESSALQHARDEVERLSEQVAEMEVERDKTRKQLRGILSKIKAVGGELRS